MKTIMVIAAALALSGCADWVAAWSGEAQRRELEAHDAERLERLRQLAREHPEGLIMPAMPIGCVQTPLTGGGSVINCY